MRGRRVDQQLIEKIGWPCLWFENVPAVTLGAMHTESFGLSSDNADNRNYLETTAQSITVMFHGDNRDEQPNMSGLWEQGQCTGTIDANIPVAVNERIIPQVHPFPDAFTFERGSGSSDTLRSRWVQEIRLLRDEANTYREGADFQVSASATTGVTTITWLDGGRAPAAGSRYGVKALIFPVWIVQSVPMVRALNRDDQLPWRVSLKRFDEEVNGG